MELQNVHEAYHKVKQLIKSIHNAFLLFANFSLQIVNTS